MKKLLLSLAIAAVATSTAMADGYNMVQLSYDNVTMTNNKTTSPYTFLGGAKNSGDLKWDKSGSFNGVGLEYIHGFGIGNKPMYIEVGGKFSFTFFHKTAKVSGDLEGYDAVGNFTMNQNLIRLGIPVSYAYKFHCGNNFSVTPYAGLDFRFNLASSIKYKENVTIYDDGDAYEDESDYDPINVFSKDDTADQAWNRFQLGWHIGARVEYLRYSLGLNLGTDFIPMWKYEKHNLSTFNLSLSLGYRF